VALFNHQAAEYRYACAKREFDSALRGLNFTAAVVNAVNDAIRSRDAGADVPVVREVTR
jgi:hypothetical protein